MIEVRTGEQYILVRNAYEVKEKLKHIGAEWRPSLGGWVLPASPRAAAEFRTLGIMADIDEGFARLLDDADAIASAAAAKSMKELPPIPGKTDAWLHQRQAYHFSMDSKLDGTMLAMGMGTGKSRTVIGMAEGHEAQSMYILGPKRTLKVWNGEFPKHADREWEVIQPPLNATVAKKAVYVRGAVKLAVARKQPFVVCLNHEAFWRKPMFDMMRENKWDLGYVDESHRIKAPGGKASMWAARLRPHTRKRICGSGTPMGHSPLDIYGQYRYLDPSIFGTSNTMFKARYSITVRIGDDEAGFDKVVGYQNETELADKFGSIAYICGDEVLDLPEAFDVPRPFEMSPRTRKAYNTIDAGIALQVRDGLITTTNALTKLLRLQQVTSGVVKDDDGVEQHIGDDKLEVLRETLVDLGDEPTVVFCRFRSDIARIRELCTELGLTHGELSGAEDSVLTETATMRDDIQIAVVQEQAGGSGVDFTRACIAIYYSISFSLTDYDQSRKRLHRPGQKRHVRYFHLIAEGTKDEVVYEALKNRRDIIEAVLEAARRQ